MQVSANLGGKSLKDFVGKTVRLPCNFFDWTPALPVYQLVAAWKTNGKYGYAMLAVPKLPVINEKIYS